MKVKDILQALGEFDPECEVMANAAGAIQKASEPKKSENG